jgi:RNA polymerase sigma-70 factor (ECF subfamily)
LILRLQDGGDEAAWEEFVAIYRPVIVRMAVLKGLQHSDAEDLSQKVLLSVAKKIPEWEHDPARAKFRTWLGRVVRNATLNTLSRMPADRGDGRTTAMLALAGYADKAANDSEVFELEWRREAFRWIADQVREEFQPATWDAFWLTAVDGLTAEETSQKIGKSIGAVYVARTRVMQRIQAKLKQLTGELVREDRDGHRDGDQSI